MDRNIMQHARPGRRLRVLRLGAGGLALLATLPAWAQRPTTDDGQRPLGITASPEGPKVTMRVGEERRFRVESIGSDVTYRWTLDARPVGTAMQWTFAPSATHLGVHRVDIVVRGVAGVFRRSWYVRVLPPRPPRLRQATPAAETVEVPAHRSVRLALRVEPTTPAETIHVQWTLDGDPVGEGTTLRLRPGRVGTHRVRALATSSLGSAVAREWRLVVTVPVTTTTAPVEMAALETPSTTAPSTSSTVAERVTSTTATTVAVTVRRATTSSTVAERAARTTTTTIAVAARRTTTTRPPAALPDAEVRGLLDRYAAAMRAHDIAELRRLGQITNDRQAEAMEGYFANARDLHVEVRLLEVRGDGDRATVRFTRRDSFRDPTGRLVTQESPPIEKRLERTPSGLRFAGPAQ